MVCCLRTFNFLAAAQIEPGSDPNTPSKKKRCELDGGWLVNIEDVHEQNCLLKYALTTSGLHDKNYWTDGINKDIYLGRGVLGATSNEKNI